MTIYQKLARSDPFSYDISGGLPFRAPGRIDCVRVMGQAVPEMNSANQIVGYVGAITNITVRKRVEDLKLGVAVAEKNEILSTA